MEKCHSAFVIVYSKHNTIQEMRGDEFLNLGK